MNLAEAARPIFEEVYKQKKEKLDQAEKFRIDRRALTSKFNKDKNQLRRNYLKDKSLMHKQQIRFLNEMDKLVIKNEAAIKRLLGPKHFQIERQKFLRGKRENDEKGLGSNNTGREVRTENSRGKDTKTDNAKM